MKHRAVYKSSALQMIPEPGSKNSSTQLTKSSLVASASCGSRLSQTIISIVEYNKIKQDNFSLLFKQSSIDFVSSKRLLSYKFLAIFLPGLSLSIHYSFQNIVRVSPINVSSNEFR